MKIPIPNKFCNFLASTCALSRPKSGQPGGYFGPSNLAYRWGLAFGAHKAAKSCKREVNFLPYRPIAAGGVGGDREALTITRNRLAFTLKVLSSVVDTTLPISCLKFPKKSMIPTMFTNLSWALPRGCEGNEKILGPPSACCSTWATA